MPYPRLLYIFPFILLLGGCGSGTPRFSNSDEKSVEKRETRESSVRFARELERAGAEERAEDDVKVDLQEVKSRFNGDAVITHPDSRQTKILSEILRYIGIPYRLGGSDLDGMDCSWYTHLVFRNTINVELPRTTVEQFRLGRRVSRSDLRFGDLVFFNTTGTNPSHVGIYIGDNLFAHASVTYGVTISSLESTYYGNRITGIRRIIN